MRILITGGAGFIGTHLCSAAIADGHDVRVLDKRAGALACDYRIGDICDERQVRDAMEGCDAVIHLAAEISVARSVEQPAQTEAVNLHGSRNVLAAAHALGVRAVVCASSAAVYGDTNVIPTTEESPKLPLSPYGATKLAMEAAAEEFAQRGLRTCCLRLFNVYGPGQRPDSKYAAAIPMFIARALRGETITINGDGEYLRDFVYVHDVARAFLLAIERGSGVMNIATGHAVSINTLARTIIGIAGSASTVRHDAARPGDLRTSLADVTRARERLGFVASVTLEDGLRATIASFSSSRGSR